MSQLSSEDPNFKVIRVMATVVNVEEKFLHLSSPDIESGKFIKVSAILASSILPRPLAMNVKLLDEYCVNDQVLLDVVPDIGHYIPQQMHALYLTRTNGVRVVADGLVIDVSEHDGVVIRSKYLPDFTCPMDRCVVSNIELCKGVLVLYEALLCNTVEGLAVRAISSETKNISFPIYHAVGTVRCNIADGSIFVRCLTGDGSGTSLTLSVYQGAYYGCGIPIKSLIGQKINCVICPLDPSVERSDLQVIYFSPSELVAASTELGPPTVMDGVHFVTQAVTIRRCFREVQCSTNFNEEIMQGLRDAFLFIVDHGDAGNFYQMVQQYPAFVAAMLNELNMKDGIQPSTGDYQQFLREMARKIGGYANAPEDDGSLKSSEGHIPTAPNFMPDDISLDDEMNDKTIAESEDDEMMKMAAAHLAVSNNNQLPVAAQQETQGAAASVVPPPAIVQQNMGGARPKNIQQEARCGDDCRPRESEAPVFNRKRSEEQLRPVFRMSEISALASIKPLGRSQAEERAMGSTGSSSSVFGTRSQPKMFIGKMKPG